MAALTAHAPATGPAVAAALPADTRPLAVLTMDALPLGGHPFAHIESALDESYPLPGAGAGLPLRYEYAWHHLNRGRHAEIALRDGAMHCTDPFTGQRLSAQSACVLPCDWLAIAYRFHGAERFDLITSSFDQAKLGLYFHDRRTFIAGRVDANWVAIGSQAATALAAHDADAQPWRDDSRAGAVLHLGFCNNLGHFMWNDLSGLAAVVDSGALAQVGSVVVGPHSFFPVAALFPELAAAGIHIEHWAKPLPACVRHTHTLPLRVAGNRITRSLRRRIVGWAIEQQRDELVALAPLNGPGLNLWFNLRLHNKAWVDQVQGIVVLAQALRRSLPAGQTLRLVLDGTPDTTPLVERIAQLLQGIVHVTDATRVPLSRSLVLSGLVDLHVCVVGSGLTLPHWVMGRRGVAHANRPHLLQQRFWNNVAEGTHDVSFVPVSAVTDLDAPVLPDTSYVNYRLDPAAVLERLDTLYRQLDTGPRRSGFAQMQHLAEQGRFGDAAERLISV